MGELFYTVPDAITFRNVGCLGKQGRCLQARTLLLQNKSSADMPVFLSLPFTQFFSLELESNFQQKQEVPPCLVTKVPAQGSTKVIVKLHTPPNMEEIENFHDCLVVVMGKTPLLVPVRAVKQQLDPASGSGLQECGGLLLCAGDQIQSLQISEEKQQQHKAVLSQLPFHPPQDQLDDECEAFVLTLANQLQLGLPHPTQSQQQQQQQHEHQTQQQQQQQQQQEWQGMHSQHDVCSTTQRSSNSRVGTPKRSSAGEPLQPSIRSSSAGGLQLSRQGSSVHTAHSQEALPSTLTTGLTPDTFSQVPQPTSSSDSEDEPAVHSPPHIPQLCHTISVKGRTAYAKRSTALLDPSHTNSSPPLDSTMAAEHTSPGPESPPAAGDAEVQHNAHTVAAAAPPDSLSSSPRMGEELSSAVGNPVSQKGLGGGKQSSQQATLACLHAGTGQETCIGCTGSSSSRSVSSSRTGSLSGSTRARGVFQIGGRYFNARGEEMGTPGGTSTADSVLCSEHPGQQQAEAGVRNNRPPSAGSQHPAALVSAMRDLGLHDLPSPAAPPSPLRSSPAACAAAKPSKSGSLPAPGCLSQLDLPHLPSPLAPRPLIYGSTSSMTTSSTARRSGSLQPPGPSSRAPISGRSGSGSLEVGECRLSVPQKQAKSLHAVREVVGAGGSSPAGQHVSPMQANPLKASTRAPVAPADGGALGRNARAGSKGTVASKASASGRNVRAEEDGCERELEAHIARDLGIEQGASAGTLAERGPGSEPEPRSTTKMAGTARGAAPSASKPPRVGVEKRGASSGVGAASSQQQQPQLHKGRSKGVGESEEDEGEDFAQQLAHTIEQQIHKQAGAGGAGDSGGLVSRKDKGVGARRGSGSGVLERSQHSAAAAAVKHARGS